MTIHDVARAAKVSIGTVSRVVNGHVSVNPQIRRSVEQAIAELGYRPNGSARDLRRGRTRTIGVVISDLANPVFSATVQGIEQVAGARGTSLFLCDAAGLGPAQAPLLERLHVTPGCRSRPSCRSFRTAIRRGRRCISHRSP